MNPLGRPLLLGLLAVLLAGCPVAPDTTLQPNAVDAARAKRVAADPWAAPTTTAKARELVGSNHWVNREVGSRTTTVAGASDRPIVLREVRAAVADGWTLVAAACPKGSYVHVELARGSHLDDFARAIVTTVATGSVTVPAYDLTVRVFVPHHADRSWPRPAPVTLERNCLVDPAVAAVTVKDVSHGARFGSTD